MYHASGKPVPGHRMGCTQGLARCLVTTAGYTVAFSLMTAGHTSSLGVRTGAILWSSTCGFNTEGLATATDDRQIE